MNGRDLTLAPITAGAARVIDGEDPKDLGALVAQPRDRTAGGTIAIERRDADVSGSEGGGGSQGLPCYLVHHT